MRRRRAVVLLRYVDMVGSCCPLHLLTDSFLRRTSFASQSAPSISMTLLPISSSLSRLRRRSRSRTVMRRQRRRRVILARRPSRSCERSRSRWKQIPGTSTMNLCMTIGSLTKPSSARPPGCSDLSIKDQIQFVLYQGSLDLAS